MKGERAAWLAAGLAACAVLLPTAARGDDLSDVYARVELFLALLPAIGRVVTKAGYSVCWMLWSLVPGVNLIMLYAFAF
jgi:hypothetical protein